MAGASICQKLENTPATAAQAKQEHAQY